MKLIAVYDNYATYNNCKDAALDKKGAPVIYSIADTALLKDGKPFFVPDFATPCTCEAHLVVRISRLGRSVSPRFARRYYDAATVGVSFTARNLFDESRNKGLPWELSCGFDGAAPVGEMVELDERGIDPLTFRIELDGKEMQRGHAADMLHSVDECLAYVSRFYMIRQGDLLFTGSPLPPFAVEPGHRVTGFLGERQVLGFNIR